MYILIHLAMIDSLCCITSCLSQLIVYFIIYLSYLSYLCSACDMSDIHVICMFALLLCDACITCLCGTHIYHLTSNSLVSVDLVSFNLVFDTRLVTLFALRLS